MTEAEKTVIEAAKAYVNRLDTSDRLVALIRAVAVLEAEEADLPQCPFDFAHTRHWCGYPACRDA